jgi:hypothetical protein
MSYVKPTCFMQIQVFLACLEVICKVKFLKNHIFYMALLVSLVLNQ